MYFLGRSKLIILSIKQLIWNKGKSYQFLECITDQFTANSVVVFA